MTVFNQTRFDGERVTGFPCAGVITSRFGARDIAAHAQGHTGDDIGPDGGAELPVYAPADGSVLSRFVVDGETEGWRIAWTKVFGNSVILDHGQHVTLYGHLRDAPLVESGQVLRMGEQIGVVGNTGESFGNHLHWGMAPRSNPYLQRDGLGGLLDPLDYLNGYAEAPAEPTDHQPEPEEKTPAYLGRQIYMDADVLRRALEGGAPPEAVSDIAQFVADAALEIVAAS